MAHVILQLMRPIIILCCIVFSMMLFGASLVLAGGGSNTFESSWRSEEITIDGNSGDWNEQTFYLEDLKGVVNVCNDDEHLYLCLLSADRDVMRQIMMSGMTIWFDHNNKKNKSFGFRFTVGRGDRPERGERSQTAPNSDMSGGLSSQGEQIDEAEIQKRFAKRMEQMSSFEIVGPDNSTRVVQMSDSLGGAESPGVEVKTGFSNGAFMYELKIPLERNDEHHHGIDSTPGGQIAIGFHSPEIDRKQMMGDRQRPDVDSGMSGGRGGGMSGGRGGGMSGGRGGGMGGGRGGGRGSGMGGGQGGSMGQRPDGDNANMPEPFEVWLTVQLASQ